MLFSKVDLFFSSIKTIVNLFSSGINKIVDLFSFSNKFLNIFEHINCPLSVIILKPRKPMSEN